MPLIATDRIGQTPAPKRRQHGLTLVELTVTLLILTVLATIAIRSTNDLAFQARYEQTKERLETIRHAILGNPRLIINGQQAISGFVADMGRLPNCLRELMENYNCDTGLANPTWANAGDPSNLSVGWHGPYLNVSGNPGDKDAFTDGWGREAKGYCATSIDTDPNECDVLDWVDAADDHNYGWYFNQLSEDNLTILSYGKDQAIGGGVDYYDADYPANQPLIRSTDWLVDISSGISVNISKLSSTDRLCGFDSSASYSSESACKNAGGNWSGSCVLDESSCKNVGGRWNSCFFSPQACSVAGGTHRTLCKFSEKSCEAAGGADSWDTVSTNATYRTCLIHSDSDKCDNAGGSWNSTSSSCDFNNSTCLLAGGAWIDDCQFTSATCPTANPGVTWESVEKPESCNFTLSACNSLNGYSVGDSYCYMSHAEYVGVKYVSASCDGSTGKWTGKICAIVFYRDPSTSSVIYAASNPISITGNIGFQTLLFSQFSSGGSPVPKIPTGQNAIGIYEYDGDCNPDNPFYPADRQNPIVVDFRPNTTLPVINW